jgi:hypothetical protein
MRSVGLRVCLGTAVVLVAACAGTSKAPVPSAAKDPSAALRAIVDAPDRTEADRAARRGAALDDGVRAARAKSSEDCRVHPRPIGD